MTVEQRLKEDPIDSLVFVTDEVSTTDRQLGMKDCYFYDYK